MLLLSRFLQLKVFHFVCVFPHTVPSVKNALFLSLFLNSVDSPRPYTRATHYRSGGIPSSTEPTSWILYSIASIICAILFSFYILVTFFFLTIKYILIFEVRTYKVKIKIICISLAGNDHCKHFRISVCFYWCIIRSNFFWLCAFFFSLIWYHVYLQAYHIVYEIPEGKDVDRHFPTWDCHCQ